MGILKRFFEPKEPKKEKIVYCGAWVNTKPIEETMANMSILKYDTINCGAFTLTAIDKEKDCE